MAITHSKLEGLITVPAGGWDINLTDQDAGPTTVTVPAGDYYLSGTGATALIDKLQSLANAAMGQTWSITIDAGQDGTGKVTIGCTGSTCTVGGAVSVLTTVLGFTSPNYVGSTSYTSERQAYSLWLPDCPTNSPYGSFDQGKTETDARSMESPAGHVSVVYSQRKSIQSLSWDGLSHKKARILGEEVPGESYEQFWRDALLAEASWTNAPGGPIRFYPDADDDGAYGVYKVPGLEEFETVAVRDGWTGLWQVSIPRMVLIPETGGQALVESQ